MRTRKNLNLVIEAAAVRMSGINIEVNTSIETVAINGDVFLQGEDASRINREAEYLWETAGEVMMEQCYACLAEPYV